MCSTQIQICILESRYRPLRTAVCDSVTVVVLGNHTASRMMARKMNFVVSSAGGWVDSAPVSFANFTESDQERIALEAMSSRQGGRRGGLGFSQGFGGGGDGGGVERRVAAARPRSRSRSSSRSRSPGRRAGRVVPPPPLEGADADDAGAAPAPLPPRAARAAERAGASAAEEMRARVAAGIAAAARRDRLGDNHRGVAWERPGAAGAGPDMAAADAPALPRGAAGAGGRAGRAAVAAADRDMMISVIGGEAAAGCGSGADADAGGVAPSLAGAAAADAAHVAAMFAPPAAIAAAAAAAAERAAAAAARAAPPPPPEPEGAVVHEGNRERGRPVYERVQLGDEVEALYREDGGWYRAVVISVTHGGYTNAEYKVCVCVGGGMSVCACCVLCVCVRAAPLGRSGSQSNL